MLANAVGAGGATGSVAAKNAKGDGYTMLFTRVGSHSVNPAMNGNLPDTLDDFCFATVFDVNPVACAVAPSSGIKTMNELFATAKTGTAAYSSVGVGSYLHLSAVMVMDRLGVEGRGRTVTHIPQKRWR
ncbi:Bug family tripartite tricarboxylate transporter substrate binding protein [Pseudorhodobacter aquimaris]|uniref:Bug family tripartite tricarboxylate transporter substrate binding protein n=1 Tax=Pseudorhodobacter aquimaris TaxID=687412 RepID=UPI001E4D81F4|nr:tripartite tricarboxylate transporter substrate-binding protein [Pseudorhodobacter aquimaris]